MNEESPVEIFLKAEGQTYFSQQIPENTATATANVISIYEREQTLLHN